jgi:hypothetical protein
MITVPYHCSAGLDAVCSRTSSMQVMLCKGAQGIAVTPTGCRLYYDIHFELSDQRTVAVGEMHGERIRKCHLVTHTFAELQGRPVGHTAMHDCHNQNRAAETTITLFS